MAKPARLAAENGQKMRSAGDARRRAGFVFIRRNCVRVLNYDCARIETAKMAAVKTVERRNLGELIRTQAELFNSQQNDWATDEFLALSVAFLLFCDFNS